MTLLLLHLQPLGTSNKNSDGAVPVAKDRIHLHVPQQVAGGLGAVPRHLQQVAEATAREVEELVMWITSELCGQSRSQPELS